MFNPFTRRPDQHEIFVSHPQYDPQSRRILLAASQIEQLEPKEVDLNEIGDAMSTWEFNPTFYYKDKVKLLPNEVGHDLHYRYVERTNNAP